MHELFSSSDIYLAIDFASDEDMRVGGVVHCSESTSTSHSRQQQTRTARTSELIREREISQEPDVIISDNWFPNEEDYDLDEESVMMVKLDKDLRSKNISQLEAEHFYEKLMALKQEQADHIRLVEKVYRSEVYMEEPRGILKTSQPEVVSICIFLP